MIIENKESLSDFRMFSLICKMALQVCSLNSGSNGNCYYIGNGKDAVLVDAGISCREIEKRLKRNNLSVEKIRAIFISHEHSDHIRGVRVFSKKHGLPVYITYKTLKNSPLFQENPLFIPLLPNAKVEIGELRVKAFPKYHDAADPHSFIIYYQNKKVGVLTDIGEACDEVIAHFKLCDVAFLEANYDDEMLEKGNYPYHLKRRIKGRLGHLSNRQAFDLFTQHRSPNLSHLFLSHISRDNNDPDIIRQLFSSNANGTKIIIASREMESEVVTLDVGGPGEIHPATGQLSLI